MAAAAERHDEQSDSDEPGGQTQGDGAKTAPSKPPQASPQPHDNVQSKLEDKDAAQSKGDQTERDPQSKTEQTTSK